MPATRRTAIPSIGSGFALGRAKRGATTRDPNSPLARSPALRRWRAAGRNNARIRPTTRVAASFRGMRRSALPTPCCPRVPTFDRRAERATMPFRHARRCCSVLVPFTPKRSPSNNTPHLALPDASSQRSVALPGPRRKPLRLNPSRQNRFLEATPTAKRVPLNPGPVGHAGLQLRTPQTYADAGVSKPHPAQLRLACLACELSANCWALCSDRRRRSARSRRRPSSDWLRKRDARPTMRGRSESGAIDERDRAAALGARSPDATLTSKSSAAKTTHSRRLTCNGPATRARAPSQESRDRLACPRTQLPYCRRLSRTLRNRTKQQQAIAHKPCRSQASQRPLCELGNIKDDMRRRHQAARGRRELSRSKSLDFA